MGAEAGSTRYFSYGTSYHTHSALAEALGVNDLLVVHNGAVIYDMKKRQTVAEWGIDLEINYIIRRGVEIRYNSPININFTIEDLKRDGYQAIFIAAGHKKVSASVSPGS